LLVKKGANIEAADNYGFTPLHYAIRNGHKVAGLKIEDYSIPMLLEYGANMYAKNNFGQTPLSNAKYLRGKDKELLNFYAAFINHARLMPSPWDVDALDGKKLPGYYKLHPDMILKILTIVLQLKFNMSEIIVEGSVLDFSRNRNVDIVKALMRNMSQQIFNTKINRLITFMITPKKILIMFKITNQLSS